jgi:tripartite-type tricarboxylate transporter receptor subunit TctC
MIRRRLWAAGLFSSLLATSPLAATAQAYPGKPITVIVPFAPGGGSDNIARLITSKLAERTGKVFIIDNRPGAGTNIGNDAAARATPDGYTVLLAQFTLSVNPYLYANLRYHPEKDFMPVVHIADAPTVLVVPASAPFRDVPALIGAAKAQPGKFNFGSGGAGTSVHLAGELFKSMTRTQLVHIPYKGSAPAMTDLIGGQVEMMFDTSTSALPHVKGGKVRALAVAAGRRLKELPDVPTFAEQGIKDFEVPAWYGLTAPAGTPAPALQWLNHEVNEVLKDPAVVAKLDAIGAIPVGGTPAEMGMFMKAQSVRWARVIKDANIKLD